MHHELLRCPLINASWQPRWEISKWWAGGLDFGWHCHWLCCSVCHNSHSTYLPFDNKNDFESLAKESFGKRICCRCIMHPYCSRRSVIFSGKVSRRLNQEWFQTVYTGCLSTVLECATTEHWQSTVLRAFYSDTTSLVVTESAICGTELVNVCSSALCAEITWQIVDALRLPSCAAVDDPIRLIAQIGSLREWTNFEQIWNMGKLATDCPWYSTSPWLKPPPKYPPDILFIQKKLSVFSPLWQECQSRVELVLDVRGVFTGKGLLVSKETRWINRPTYDSSMPWRWLACHDRCHLYPAFAGSAAFSARYLSESVLLNKKYNATPISSS